MHGGDGPATASWEIRAAVPDDADALCRLNDVVAREGRYIVPDYLFFTPDQQRAVLTDRDPLWHQVWVAAVAGDAVAELEVVRGMWAKNRHTATVGMLVAPSWRRQGIGTALLKTVDGWARAVGVAKLCLAVFADNDAAIALYRACGYEEEGRRPDQYRRDGRSVAEILMAKYPGP